MKKLLLASIIMIGVSTAASAQTPAAVKAKKEAAKVNSNSPSIKNAAGESSAVAVPATQVATVDGTPTAKQIEVKKAKAAAQPKTVAPVRKSVKTN